MKCALLNGHFEMQFDCTGRREDGSAAASVQIRMLRAEEATAFVMSLLFPTILNFRRV